jgi:hypothetical protein
MNVSSQAASGSKSGLARARTELVETGTSAKKPAAGRSIQELEAWREDFLVELMALVQKYWPEAGRPPGRL